MNRTPVKTANATCIQKVHIFTYSTVIIYLFTIYHLALFTLEGAFAKLDINTSSERKSVGSSRWDPFRF